MPIIEPQQILVPKKVYIGDTAELRCTFNTANPEIKKLVSNGSVFLNTSTLTDGRDNQKDYEIKSVSLSPAGVDFYQFSISFVPWKTGELLFSPMEIEGSDLIIEFQPVQIVSLISTENAATTTLHDTAAPLLLPGTAYKLYGTLAAFILIIIISIRVHFICQIQANLSPMLEMHIRVVMVVLLHYQIILLVNLKKVV